jgi:hypothetical protein
VAALCSKTERRRFLTHCFTGERREKIKERKELREYRRYEINNSLFNLNRRLGTAVLNINDKQQT